MNKEYYAYREQHKVIPPLDLINFESGDFSNLGESYCRLSKWAINSKPSGNLDKGRVAGGALKAAAGLAGGLLSIGTGVSMGGMATMGDGISSAISAVNDSNMLVLKCCAEAFEKWEKSRWQILYMLYTFEPANGKIGELVKGDCNQYGYSGYCFYENGDYFEGFFHNDGSCAGIFVYANGDRAYGVFYEGNMYEQCYYLRADGTRIYGEFEKGQLVTGVMCDDNAAFMGEWRGGLLHGEVGAARYADGSCFFGDWRNGNPVA